MQLSLCTATLALAGLARAAPFAQAPAHHAHAVPERPTLLHGAGPGASMYGPRVSGAAQAGSATPAAAPLGAWEAALGPLGGLAGRIAQSAAEAWRGFVHGAAHGVDHSSPARHYRPRVRTSNSTVIAQNQTVFVVYGDSWNGGWTGVPDNPATTLKGYTHYNIAFLLHNGPADNAQLWAQVDAATQKQYKAAYNAAGIKLMVSAFGATDNPQSSGQSATKVATYIANWVKKNNLDGVDIDYEETDLFSQGKSLPWLIALQQSLRKQLPSPQYTITHAPMAPWFSWAVYNDGGYSAFDDAVGNTVDFYNVQFYNQGLYTDCNGLIFQSGGWAPESSALEIHTQGGVPLERIVIGKPATKPDADNGGDGWVDPRILGGCLAQGRKAGLNAGFMLWEWPHATLARLNNIKGNAGYK